MTPSAKLVTRLAGMGVPLRPGSTIRRTHAGRAQREQGAWSWFVDPDPAVPGTDAGLGSYTTVTDLARTARLMVVHERSPDGRGPGGLTVYPWTPPVPGGYPRRFEENPRGQ